MSRRGGVSKGSDNDVVNGVSCQPVVGPTGGPARAKGRCTLGTHDELIRRFFVHHTPDWESPDGREVLRVVQSWLKVPAKPRSESRAEEGNRKGARGANAEAKDIAQRTLLAIVRACDKGPAGRPFGNDPSQFKRWCLRIRRNERVNLIRAEVHATSWVAGCWKDLRRDAPDTPSQDKPSHEDPSHDDPSHDALSPDDLPPDALLLDRASPAERRPNRYHHATAELADSARTFWGVSSRPDDALEHAEKVRITWAAIQQIERDNPVYGKLLRLLMDCPTITGDELAKELGVSRDNAYKLRERAWGRLCALVARMHSDATTTPSTDVALAAKPCYVTSRP